MPHSEMKPFENIDQLENWLRDNHDTETVLWVQIFKKKSGVESVTWNDCIVASIIWGWIDSQKKSIDELSYLQRLTPRRAKSNWSKKNVNHVETLISENRMQPSGMVHVMAAKEDGRWENAYAGSADMVIPDDFLAEFETRPIAKAHYETLNRRNLFVIYHRLQYAKKPQTRENRMIKILATLERQENFH